MQFLAAGRRGFFVLLLVATGLGTGCGPAFTGLADETREPHYRRAGDLRNEKQYTRAAEEYERAIQALPNSASAHLDLARLLHDHLDEPDRAIHHFRQYLRLRPDDPEDRRKIILGRIEDCRRRLAGPIAVPVINDHLVRSVEMLQLERTNLLRELQRVQFNLAQASNDVLRLTGLLARLQGQGFTSAPPPAVLPPAAAAEAPRVARSPAAPAERAVAAPAPRPDNPPPAAPVLNHYIRRGDTVGSLARRYGTTSDAILRANPGLDPRRLREGQKVRIPRR